MPTVHQNFLRSLEYVTIYEHYISYTVIHTIRLAVQIIELLRSLL